MSLPSSFCLPIKFRDEQIIIFRFIPWLVCFHWEKKMESDKKIRKNKYIYTYIHIPEVMITNIRTWIDACDDWTLRKHCVFCTQLGHCPSFILATGERIIEGRNVVPPTLMDNSCFKTRNVTGKSHRFHEIHKNFKFYDSSTQSIKQTVIKLIVSQLYQIDIFSSFIFSLRFLNIFQQIKLVVK